MKHVLLALLLMISLHLSAQITLLQSDYPSTMIGTDSLRQTTAGSAFPSFSPGTNMLWDLSTITDTTPLYFAYRVPTSVYQFADSNYYSFSSYSYQGNVQSSVTSIGLFQYGINISDTAYSVSSAIAGGTSDSIFIPAQNIEYTAPECKIALPSVFHSSWQSAWQYDFNYRLSLEIYGLDHAPCMVRSYVVEKDSITGWGKMSIKNFTDSPSVYVDVLQVETIINTVDSFLLSGSTSLINPILANFGLAQGQTTITCQQNYYRVGAVTPLAQVSFSDASFVHPYKAVTNPQRLIDAVPNAVPNVITGNDIKVYPNPAMGSYVSVELPATGGLWLYELIDITGKVIGAGTLSLAGKQVQVPLAGTLSAGIYYLRFMNDGRQVMVKPIEISK